MPSLHWTLAFWPLTLALHGIAEAATPAPPCAVYNAQSRTSAEHLNRELLIANSPLRLADLQAGRNPKLAAYMAQFADDVQAHGLQGQGEPAGLAAVRDHCGKVMSAASPPVPDPDNKFRTGPVWRNMARNPRDADPHQFRRDLRAGDDRVGGRIDRDGDRLNAVFNGEQVLLSGDFTLVNGAFTYRAPMPLAPAVTEMEGLQPVAADAPYGRLPVSGWSRVGFQSQLTQAVAGAGTSTAHTSPARYCAQWIMLLRNEDTPPAREPKAQEVWLNLHHLEQPGGHCNDHFAREHAAAKGRECQANPAWCEAAK